MRHIFLCTLLILTTFGLTINDVAAKGFGGGRGFGTMRSKSMFSSPHAQKTTHTSSRPANNSRWRGALTGLLLGSLLTSMFMGHGFGGMLFSWFIIGMIIYLVANFIRRKNRVSVR